MAYHECLVLQPMRAIASRFKKAEVQRLGRQRRRALIEGPQLPTEFVVTCQSYVATWPWTRMGHACLGGVRLSVKCHLLAG